MKNTLLKGSSIALLVSSILLMSAGLPLSTNADAFGVSVSVSPNPANVNQTVTFTATPTGGIGIYSYTWSGDCSGSSQTCQRSFASAGNYTASVMVVSNGQAVTGNATVTVNSAINPPLAITVTASPNPANVNQTVTFTASSTGGNGSYSYNWSGDCSGSASTCQRSFASAGNYTASVMVVSGSASQTGVSSVTVNSVIIPSLAVTVSASPNPANVNQTVTYTATPTGGNGSYIYNWSGDCSGSASTCQRAYPTAGNYTASVLVTSAGQAVTGTRSVTVLGGNITCSTDSQCGTDGFTGSPFCQNGDVYQNYITYTCHNAGTVSSSCSNDTNARLKTNCTSTQTCSNGSCAGSSALAVTVSASPNPANVNQTVTYTATPTGGNGSYIYNWSGDCSGSASTCQRAYPTAGNYTASVLVTSAGQAVTGTRSVTVNSVINPALAVTVSASPNPANINQTVTFTASPTGGNGSYTYLWSGDCSGSASTCQRAYPTAGNYTASVLVTSAGQAVTGTRSVTVLGSGHITCSTDSQCGTDGFTGSPFCQNGDVYQNYITYTCNNAGTTSSSCSNDTNVRLRTNCSTSQICSNGSCTGSSALGVTVSASPNPANVNQTVTYTATPTGGHGSYIYTWSGDCSGSASTCQRAYPTAGNYTASVLVTSGNQGVTGTASVTVVNNGNVCTQNYQQRCVGNNLYWYDSCGNQQNLSQYCPSGCYNNVCQNFYTCTQNYQQRCVGNNLYSFDSCGNQQNLIQYCANGCNNNACQNSGTPNLTVIKTVKNLTSASGFSSSTYARPSDTLMFMITIQNSNNQQANNVFVRDILPANLIYSNQLVVACSGSNAYNNNCSSNYSYSGNVVSGVNLNTIYAGQTVTITYQTQVASEQNFSYGSTTLTNSVTVTSSQTGYNPTSNATVIVNKGAVLGASTVSTGLTNNIWFDSFILPLLLAMIGLGMWKTGMFVTIERWLDRKRKISRTYKAEKELNVRIAQIKRAERG